MREPEAVWSMLAVSDVYHTNIIDTWMFARFFDHAGMFCVNTQKHEDIHSNPYLFLLTMWKYIRLFWGNKYFSRQILSIPQPSLTETSSISRREKEIRSLNVKVHNISTLTLHIKHETKDEEDNNLYLQAQVWRFIQVCYVWRNVDDQPHWRFEEQGWQAPLSDFKGKSTCRLRWRTGRRKVIWRGCNLSSRARCCPRNPSFTIYSP